MKAIPLIVLKLCVFNWVYAQNVGIGVNTPISKLHIVKALSGAVPFAFSPLTIENNDHCYINLLSPAANETAILFGQPASAANGVIMYNNATTPNGFQFRNNNNQTRMVLTQSGALGIGTTNPQALLEVNGGVKCSSLLLTSGGVTSDFLVKKDNQGTVGFKKGNASLGLNYIIALEGNFPSQTAPMVQGVLIGEIKLFSGTQAPFGWAFCNGQQLQVSSYMALFSVIGTTYGGNGTTHFALPDLRNTTAVGVGSNWVLGETNN